MTNKFKLGTSVFFAEDGFEIYKLDSSFRDDTELCIGEAIITREAENDLVLISSVGINDMFPLEGDLEIEVDLLSTEEEYQEFLNLKSTFEKDLSDKINKAAELISEAQTITLNYKECNLSEMYHLVRPLLKAIDNAGWCSSSLMC
tara:strand:+ start:125 stop:562 length:438 start_codon:yes stop_codon:yes gene_type:complete